MKSVASAILPMSVAFSTLLLSGCSQKVVPEPAPQTSAAPTAVQPTAIQTAATAPTEIDKSLPAFPTGSSVSMPAGFPVPKYPGSKVITAQQVPKQQALAMLLTTDDVAKVAHYYRGLLGQQGWSIQKTLMKAAPGTEVLTAAKPGQLAVVSIVRNENLTRIDIVVSPSRR